MRMRLWFPVLVLLVAVFPPCASAGEAALSWEELPPLPDPMGFAGPYAGVSNGALIVAGGANFPEAPPWADGAKVWYDSVFVLPEPDGEWLKTDGLPRPLGYGVSLTSERGVVCLGGGDAARHYADVFLLTWEEGRVRRESLPPMPRPAAFFCGAMLGETVYVAGGLQEPKSPKPLKTFWALDLAEETPAWQEVEPWPGRARMLATAGAQGGAFYLFAGTDLVPGEEGKPTREYLRDAYRFVPGAGWSRIADIPVASVAAPTPAVAMGDSHLLVLGGDDGEYVYKDLREAHPGFPPHMQAYHAITDTWTTFGALPLDPGKDVYPPVTTVTVEWNGKVVVPSGEVKPGIRTPRMLVGTPTSRVSGFGMSDYMVLTAYLAALVGMGFYFSRREHGTEDFFLAGRRIPWWAAGLSIFGTQLSAITFMAIPAKTYATDWTYFLGNMCIIAIAPAVVFLYLPFFRRLDVTTAYEYLEKRFNLATRLFGSLAFVLMQLGRMGIVLFLPALALAAVTGINVYACILVMGVLATLYTVLGGIEAVIWTDVLQVFVLLGGALIALGIILADAGGAGNLVSMAQEQGKFHTFTWSWDHTMPVVWVVVLGNLFGNLIPYTSDQTVVQRYLTTADEARAAKAIWTNAVLTIPATLIFFSIGTALFVFYKAHPGELNPALKNDAIFAWFIADRLPMGVAGLVIAGVFAASMSSLDSSMNSVATAVTTDFIRRFSPERPDGEYLRIARWLTVVLGVVGTGTALLMAASDIKSLWDVFTKLLGLFGGSLAGMFALGILTRRANGKGVLVGAFTSAAVLFLVQRFTSVHFFLYGATGIVTCVVVGYAASLALPGDGRSLDGLTIGTLRRDP